MKYTVLFDMDGVLIDSECAIRTAAIEALKDFGVDACHEDFMEFTGMGEDRFVGGVAEKHNKTYIPQMKAKAYELYGTQMRDLIIVYEGISELVHDFKNEGRKTAVASAADRVKVLINLDCIGVTVDDFSAVITGSEVSKKKPDPEIYLKAAAMADSLPNECIVVEDAPAGIKAAKAAGMLCAGVTSSFSSEVLKEAGADYVLEHTSQLKKLLMKLES